MTTELITEIFSEVLSRDPTKQDKFVLETQLRELCIVTVDYLLKGMGYAEKRELGSYGGSAFRDRDLASSRWFGG